MGGRAWQGVVKLGATHGRPVEWQGSVAALGLSGRQERRSCCHLIICWLGSLPNLLKVKLPQGLDLLPLP